MYRITFFVLVFTQVCLGYLRSDLNGDRRVDFQDFSILASEWLYEENMSKFTQLGDYGHIHYASASSLNLGTGDFSISLWAKIPEAGYIFSKWSKTSTNVGYSLDMYLYNGQYPTLEFSYGPNNNRVSVSDENFVPNSNWRHIVVSVDRDTFAKMYVDNILVATEEVYLYSSTIDNSIDFIVGNGLNSTNLDLAVDDFRIYKGTSNLLDAADVSEIYADGNGKAYSALVSGKTASFVLPFDSDYKDIIGNIDGSPDINVQLVDGGKPYVTTTTTTTTTPMPPTHDTSGIYAGTGIRRKEVNSRMFIDRPKYTY